MVSRGTTLTVTLTGDASQLRRVLNGADRDMANFERSSGSASRGLLTSFSAMQAGVTAAAAGIAGAIITVRNFAQAASDLQETQSKVGVVFGDSARDIQSWASTSAAAMGVSRQQAMESAATFGNLFTALGTSRDEALKMSPALVQLAADMASFNNASPEETLLALRSGIVGEVEPLRRFGIAINAAAVENKALEMGLAATKNELTEGMKVQARYALIMEQSKTAQGDFARTSEGLANQQRTLQANFANVRAELGEKLLPVLEQGTKALNDWFASAEGRETMQNLANDIGTVAQAAADATSWIYQMADALRSLDNLSPQKSGKGIADAITGAVKRVFDIEGNLGFDFGAQRFAGSAPITDASIEGGDFSRSSSSQDPFLQTLADLNNRIGRGSLNPEPTKAEQARRQLEFEATIAQAERDIDAHAVAVKGSTSALDEFDERMKEAARIDEIRRVQLAHQIMEQAELAAAGAAREFEESTKRAAQSQQFYADYLRGLAGQNTRFAPGVFEGLARAGGLTSIGDLIAGGAAVTQTNLATGATTQVDVVVP